MTRPRNGRPYRTQREQLRLMFASVAAPCHLCGKPINYGLRYPHRMSFQLDHIVPVWQGGTDKDPTNFGPSHFHCNASRGAREGNWLRRGRRPPTTDGVPRHTSVRW